MKTTIAIITICILMGCSSADRQIIKARQIFDKYPNEAAKYCGDKFPVTDTTVSLKTDTIRVSGTDYKPALISLEILLDSTKAILMQKQNSLNNVNGQLSFEQQHLADADKLLDALSEHLRRLKTTYKPCGIDTIKSTYIKLRTNTAKIMALTSQIVLDGQEKEKLSNSLQQEKTKAVQRLYIILGLMLLAIVFLVIKIYGFFSGGMRINGTFK